MSRIPEKYPTNIPQEDSYGSSSNSATSAKTSEVAHNVFNDQQTINNMPISPNQEPREWTDKEIEDLAKDVCKELRDEEKNKPAITEIEDMARAICKKLRDEEKAEEEKAMWQIQRKIHQLLRWITGKTA